MRFYHLVHRLYHGNSRASEQFQLGLLVLDIALIAYLILISFMPGAGFVPWLDGAFAAIMLADFLARFLLERFRPRYFLRAEGLMDLAILASFILTFFGGHYTFLRAIRLLRSVQSKPMRQLLARRYRSYGDHEAVILAVTHLGLFIFIMTSLVYETQVGRNDDIRDFIDALYFTVTTLTTTGFGDVTLKGDSGKLLAVGIMIVGVSLFIRLIQAIFQAHKVRHACPQCGLEYHDRDAVHCKACGIILCIRDTGVY